MQDRVLSFRLCRQNRNTGPESAGDLRETGKRGQLVPALLNDRPRLAHSLVTPVAGDGRGTIVVSVCWSDQRRTAAFLCDVEHGICDVYGDIEPDSVSARRLLDDLASDHGHERALDVDELSLGLLAGSLMLGRSTIAPAVRDWIDGTLGPGFQPA